MNISLLDKSDLITLSHTGQIVVSVARFMILVGLILLIIAIGLYANHVKHGKFAFSLLTGIWLLIATLLQAIYCPHYVVKSQVNTPHYSYKISYNINPLSKALIRYKTVFFHPYASQLDKDVDYGFDTTYSQQPLVINKATKVYYRHHLTKLGDIKE